MSCLFPEPILGTTPLLNLIDHIICEMRKPLSSFFGTYCRCKWQFQFNFLGYSCNMFQNPVLRTNIHMNKTVYCNVYLLGPSPTHSHGETGNSDTRNDQMCSASHCDVCLIRAKKAEGRENSWHLHLWNWLWKGERSASFCVVNWRVKDTHCGSCLLLKWEAI